MRAIGDIYWHNRYVVMPGGMDHVDRNVTWVVVDRITGKVASEPSPSYLDAKRQAGELGLEARDEG